MEELNSSTGAAIQVIPFVESSEDAWKDPKTCGAETGEQLDKDSSHKIKRGDPHNPFRERPTDNFEAGSMAKAEKAIAKIFSSSSDDDQPLSMWLKNCSRIDDSTPAADGTITQMNGTKQKQNSCIGRNSPLWQMIESMEVFRLLPQNPHFHPLAEHKEEFREGLAIGYMVSFANLVEKASKLRVEDSRSSYDSLLEALAKLEVHGFDVEPVLHRVHKLLLLKTKSGHLLELSKRVKSQLAERLQMKAKINEEIIEIERKIKELKETQSIALTLKMAHESEIRPLKSDMEAIDEEILQAQLEYDRHAAAFWSLA